MEVRYTAFGEIRYESGDTTTDYTYTGQREANELGLSYYVARWYDPEIGHFTQPDSIVPGAGDALAWDRYAYVKYNPIKYVDPSGKVFIEYRYARNGAYADNNPRTTQQQLEQTYGFTFTGTWTGEEARTIWSGVNAIRNYLDQNLNSSGGISSGEWITKYLHSSFTHGDFFGNHYVLFGT